MGGAFNVGANIVTTKSVVYNEINTWVFDIIKWLLRDNKKAIINDIKKTISDFKLDKGAKEEYLKLREAYNEMDSKTLYLYVLHMYAFQNMIRFNNSKKFNTPIGVAGYSDDIMNRVLKFKPKSNVLLTDKCYTKLKWEKFPQDSVFYFDPPYFITSASYNDGKRGLKGWNGDSEIELLSNLTKIDSLGYKFILSNVLHHRNKTNHLLIEWIQEHNFKVVDVGTTGWRYAKNEVLIKNF